MLNTLEQEAAFDSCRQNLTKRIVYNEPQAVNIICNPVGFYSRSLQVQQLRGEKKEEDSLQSTI